MKYLSLVAAFALAACGGAGTTAVPVPQAQAQVQGAILEVDGQTIDRDGVDVAIVETGDRVRSRADGSFQFPDLAPGRYTLDFDPAAPRALALEGEGEGESEPKEEGDEKEEPKEEEGEREEEREHEEEGEKEREEKEESDEDELGRPRIDVDREGPVVIIKVVLDNGQVVRWSKSHPNHRFVRARLQPNDDSAAEGKVLLREWYRGERERLVFVACGLDGGDAVEIFLRDTTEEGSEAVKIAGAEANGDGCIEIGFDTQGGWLPLEAESLADLAGYEVQIRMASNGTVILEGEIPSLPERVKRHEKEEEEKEREEEGEEKEEPREEEEPKPEVAPAVYGKDQLLAQVDGVFGFVEIGDWDAKDRQRFRMIAAGLRYGEKVRFEIRDPETEEWTTFATRLALLEAEEGDGAVAKVDTEWYGVLPLDAEDVEHLSGLGVRVVRETDDGDVVLLIGEVPDLVRE